MKYSLLLACVATLLTLAGCATEDAGGRGGYGEQGEIRGYGESRDRRDYAYSRDYQSNTNYQYSPYPYYPFYQYSPQ